jgi:hypothetical protein
MKNNFKNQIKQLGKMLGLNNNDINIALNNKIKEHTSYSMGPSWYPGNHYGTISVKDF